MLDSSDPLAPTDPTGAGLGAALAAGHPGDSLLCFLAPCAAHKVWGGFPGDHRMSDLQILALPARL